MTWVITGGSGQLGIALHENLQARDISHVALSKSDLDITEFEDLMKIESYKPSLIVNCAAWTNVDGAEDNEEQVRLVNRIGAKNLAITARKIGIPLIHISTDYVFSGKQKKPWRVEDKTNPISIYGQTKREGELEIQAEYPSSSYIVRTAWLYSPWGRNFAKTILARAIKNIPSRVVDDQIGQPTSAVDLAEQLRVLAMSGAPFGVYHATNAGSASWFEFAQEIYRIAGADPNLVTPVSTQDFPTRAKRPIFSVLDNSKWSEVNIDAMQDWRIALGSVFPAILGEVKRELGYE